MALYFSLLSAFNIGWEEINIGAWIARLQPRQFSVGRDRLGPRRGGSAISGRPSTLVVLAILVF